VETRDLISLAIWAGTLAATVGAMWGKHAKELEALKQLIEDGHTAANRYIESRLAGLQQQITEMDKRRAEEFVRLHAKANDAVKVTYDNMIDSQKQFVPRSEFALLAQHVQTLENRMNSK
jgi:predicted PilT family ATPase